MKRILLFSVLFLLSFSLAAAVEVSTPKDSYASGETVTATITGCVGVSLVEFFNPTNSLVDIKSGQDNWVTTYNTLSDSADGKYSVAVTCTNGISQSNFCVDSNECDQATVEDQVDDGIVPGGLGGDQGVGGQAGGGGGGGGGQSNYIANWSCTTWSFCGEDLTQKRDCIDVNGRNQPKNESRPCMPCQESWTCSLWSDCQSGVQNRVCYDEHSCGTGSYQPGLQKGCELALPAGPEPDKISFQLPPPRAAPVVIEEKGFFARYGNYFLGIFVMILLIGVIISAIYYLRTKKMAYNINELKDWVRKEKKLGTSDEDIRLILKQKTGWNEEEIAVAFSSLK